MVDGIVSGAVHTIDERVVTGRVGGAVHTTSGSVVGGIE